MSESQQPLRGDNPAEGDQPINITVGTLDELVAAEPVATSVRQHEMNTLMTLADGPFDDPRPSDLLIKIAGKNEQGWVIEASNNTEHLPACDAQLASWFIAQLNFMPGNDLKVGNIYHARIAPIDYNRGF